ARCPGSVAAASNGDRGIALSRPRGSRSSSCASGATEHRGVLNVGRSAAYWAPNPYRLSDSPPKPSAPYRDLPPGLGDRFRLARTGLLAIRGVGEQVRFMGSPWGWTWEFGIGSRKLCWLHPITSGVSATFTLTDDEESKTLGF